MCRVKNRPKSNIIAREARDKEEERNLFPNSVHYARPEYSFHHVCERFIRVVMVMQCLLLPNFEVVTRLEISEVMSQKF
jgi:hypothetical protein